MIILCFLALANSEILWNDFLESSSSSDLFSMLVEKLHEQKGITITHQEVEGSGHFFEDPHMDTLMGSVDEYVRRRLTETTR